jgi:hypothetical protein
MLQDATLVVVSALFFYFQARHVAVDHSLSAVGFAVEQGILVVLFLTRRRSNVTSTRPWDWLIAAGGAWGPLAVRAQGDSALAAELIGVAVQFAGLALVAVFFTFLGRSFGIVAANRGLKTAGPYRFVRHPIYLAHTVTLIGFVIANWHPYNLAVLVVVTTCQVLRTLAEERVLTESTDYAAYKARVRWRLVPGVF